MKDEHDGQLTSNPSEIEHINKSQMAMLGKTATIQMHNGRTYNGYVAGRFFSDNSGTGKPRQAGGYIFIEAEGRKIRLDMLDIKTWSVTTP